MVQAVYSISVTIRSQWGIQIFFDNFLEHYGAVEMQTTQNTWIF